MLCECSETRHLSVAMANNIGEESYNFSVYENGFFMKIVDHQRKKKLFYGCDSHLLTKEYLVSNVMVIED